MSATFTIQRGDICDSRAEAVVNAWNRNFIPHWLLIPQGVSKALRKSAGLGPFRHVSRRGLLALGEVVVTDAGKMPGRYMLHAAALHAYWRASETSVRLAARSIFATARELDIRTLAIPLLGAGTGGLEPVRSFQLIYEAWVASGFFCDCVLYIYDAPTWAQLEEIIANDAAERPGLVVVAETG